MIFLHANWFRQVTFVLTLLSLAGCTTFINRSNPDNLEWSFTGKMAIRSANEASSFNVDWLQLDNAYEISLSGPLGAGEVTITGQPNKVVLSRRDEQYTYPTLQALALDALSVDLPLDHLQYWVRAQPKPKQRFKINKDSDGNVIEIQQAGWTVSINSYFNEENPRPRKLTFVKGKDSGKLIIRQWNALPQAN